MIQYIIQCFITQVDKIKLTATGTKEGLTAKMSQNLIYYNINAIKVIYFTIRNNMRCDDYTIKIFSL